MFITIVIILAVISVVMSLISLKKITNNKEINSAKKELSKGKLVFRADFKSNDKD